MTPVHLRQSASPFPFVELKDQHLQHFTLMPPDQQAASSSSCLHHHSFNLTQDHIGIHYSPESHQTQHKVNTHDLEGGSSDRHVMSSFSTSPGKDDSGNDDGSVRWMATKVRLQIRKMVNSSTNDHRGKKSTRVVVQENSEKPISASNDNVRVCSACNTTKTPLWRSGPRGPKSLCNACGIRQRKARRAMAAAEAVARNGTDMGATTTYKVHNKEKKSRTSYVIDTQKTKQENDLIISSTISPDDHDDKGKGINKFEEFAISLSKNSAFRRVFPRDEEEAAILLMALSCGLIHG